MIRAALLATLTLAGGAVVQAADPPLPIIEDLPFARLPVLQGGGDVDLRLDLFLPARSGRHPVLVLFHGGSYVMGSRREARDLALDFARRGVAVVAADYRLGFDDDASSETEAARPRLEDATAVFRWIRREAAHRSLDPERVFVGGWSSGGHLALSVGVLYPRQTERPVRLLGVLDFYGGEFSDPIDSRAVPTLVFQGTDDKACLPESGERMARRLTAAGAWSHFVLVTGMVHSWQGRWQRPLVEESCAFMGRLSRGQPLPTGGKHCFWNSPENYERVGF